MSATLRSIRLEPAPAKLGRLPMLRLEVRIAREGEHEHVYTCDFLMGMPAGTVAANLRALSIICKELAD